MESLHSLVNLRNYACCGGLGLPLRIRLSLLVTYLVMTLNGHCQGVLAAPSGLPGRWAQLCGAC